jgi:hypothetical protein
MLQRHEKVHLFSSLAAEARKVLAKKGIKGNNAPFMISISQGKGGVHEVSL